MAYNSEKRAFNHLKDNCTEELAEEYTLAIDTVLNRYNTTIHENRFVAGGAVEVFTYALLRGVGLDCQLYAAQEKRADLLLPNNKRLSIKGSFTGGLTNVKLINQLGTGPRPWNTATLFVVSEIGIIYGDPDMVSPEYIKQVSDGVELKRPGLAELTSNPANVLPLEIPRKPPTEMTGFSLKASETVAQQVLIEKELNRLLSAFPNAGKS